MPNNAAEINAAEISAEIISSILAVLTLYGLSYWLTYGLTSFAGLPVLDSPGNCEAYLKYLNNELRKLQEEEVTIKNVTQKLKTREENSQSNRVPENGAYNQGHGGYSVASGVVKKEYKRGNGKMRVVAYYQRGIRLSQRNV